jgi:hypothetical protein
VPGGVIHESDRNELDARIDINRRKGFKGDHTENEGKNEQNGQNDVYAKHDLAHANLLSLIYSYPTINASIRDEGVSIFPLKIVQSLLTADEGLTRYPPFFYFFPKNHIHHPDT